MSNNTIRRGHFLFFIPLLGATCIISCSQVDRGLGPFEFREVVAYAGVDQRSLQYLPIDLNGSGSKSPGGQSLTFRWKQIAGPEVEIRLAETARATVIPSVTGEYMFELTVVGSEGGISTDQIALSILPAVGAGSGYVMADVLRYSDDIDPIADLLVAYALASDRSTPGDDRVQLQITNNVEPEGDQLLISAIYLTPVSADYWGINLLTGSSFNWGESLRWDVIPGDHDLRALDSRGREYYSRIGLTQSIDSWQLSSDLAIDESPDLAGARRLVGRLKLVFVHDEIEYVYAYELQPFLQQRTANRAFEVHGVSQSDNASVVATFDTSTGRYRMTHTYSSDKQYCYFFELRGDVVHGASELRYRGSDRDAWAVIDVAPLTQKSLFVGRKIRK